VVVEIAASKYRITPATLPSTLTHLGLSIAPRVHPGEEAFFQPFYSQKPACSGGLLVGGRRGCNQQLHDQAGITPVDFNPPLPADPAQSALKREKIPSFSPFTPKSRHTLAVCWWVVAEVAASKCMIKPASPPSTLTHLGRSIAPKVHPGARRNLLSAFLQQKPVCYGGLLVGGRRDCGQQIQDHAGNTPIDFDPSRPVHRAKSAPRRRRSLLLALLLPKAGMFRRSAGGRSPRLQLATT
jgi:hypothetical protein